MLGMARRAPSIELTSEERSTLESMVRSPSAAQRDVIRARIVLLAASGRRNEEIQAILGVSKPVVIKWRGRFARSRFHGLTDQPGRGRKRKYDAAVRHRIAATACSTPPDSVGTHWSVRSLAKYLGVGTAVIQAVLSAEAIQPHRSRYWKSSRDPEFEPKMLAIVGLYMNPPQNAVVLSVDEKTSIQALDRTQPRRPVKPHQIERLSHEYKRNGTASLLACLDVHSGPWRKWRVFCKADDVAGYAIPRKAGSGLSGPGRVNKRTKQACQSGFSALAACPHPASGAGSGSG